MQVERSLSGESGGRVSNTYGTYPVVGDSRGKLRVSPHEAGPIGGVGEMPLSGGSQRRGVRRISSLGG